MRTHTPQIRRKHHNIVLEILNASLFPSFPLRPFSTFPSFPSYLFSFFFFHVKNFFLFLFSLYFPRVKRNFSEHFFISFFITLSFSSSCVGTLILLVFSVLHPSSICFPLSLSLPYQDVYFVFTISFSTSPLSFKWERER